MNIAILVFLDPCGMTIDEASAMDTRRRWRIWLAAVDLDRTSLIS